MAESIDGRAVFDLLMEFMPLFHQHILPPLSADLRDGLGLTRGMAKALIILSRSGPDTATELGKCMAMTKANLTILVDELVEAGFARREPHPSDRRKSLVFMTEAGRKAARAAEDAFVAGLEERLALLGPDGTERLSTGFSSIVATLKTL